MKTGIVSVRLPLEVLDGVDQIAALNRVSVPVVVDWFLLTSLSNFEVLRGLQDCEDKFDAKLDARIPVTTLVPLKAAAASLGISIAVYIRRLLHHSFVTQKLRYLKSQGDYTLACGND